MRASRDGVRTKPVGGVAKAGDLGFNLKPAMMIAGEIGARHLIMRPGAERLVDLRQLLRLGSVRLCGHTPKSTQKYALRN